MGQQSGIFTGDGGFDLEVGGQTTLIGGAITTTDAAVAAGRNNYTSLGGIVTQDIENTTSYDGDAIQIGVSLGMTDNKPQGNTNGLGYGTDGDSDSSTTRAGITGIAGNSGITTDNQAEYAGALDNAFDATRVNEELGAQTQITQAFDQERRKIKTELNQEEEKLRNAAKEALENGDRDSWEAYSQEADKIQQKSLIFDGISGALYGPNSNGAVGYVAKAISPQVAFQIGQAFKDNDYANSKNKDNELSGVGSPQHLLAHAILGAAVSVATGNDALTGGLSASTGEAAAPLISNFLYGTADPSQLTAEQKDTISSITSALGAGIGLTTGNINDAVNAAETSKVAVEDNSLKKKDVATLLQRINAAKRKYTGNKLDNEMRNIRELMGAMVANNWEEIKVCESKPTAACLKQIRTDYSNVDFKSLKDAYRLYPGTDLYINSYEHSNNSIVSCSTSRPTDCVYIDGGIRVMNAAVYEVLGAGGLRKIPSGKSPTQTANRAGQTCSFRGDMLVKTISGYRPISEVRIGNMVLSKNEITGKLTYQSVSNHYNNSYNATVYITTKDSNGNKQTIVSNKIHPFFTQVNTGAQLPQSSEGHNYQGSIDNAQWIDASNLKAGYQLLSENGQWQVVQSVRQTEESLSAYNLTVDNDHTYFVTGSDSTYGVWVHNDCWSSLPDSATYTGKTTPDGRKLVTFVDANGKRVTAYKGTDGRWYDPKVYSPTSPPPKNVTAKPPPKDANAANSFPNRDGARAAKGRVYYERTKEATEAAKVAGFERVPGGVLVHGQAVYYNSKTKKYISRDVGSNDGGGAHIGGVWKEADSVAKLGSKETRNGTLDANMKRIGD